MICPQCGTLNEPNHRVCFHCGGLILDEDLEPGMVTLPEKDFEQQGLAPARPTPGYYGKEVHCPGCASLLDIVEEGEYVCDECGADFRLHARLGVLVTDSEVIREAKRRYRDASRYHGLQVILTLLFILISCLVFAITDNVILTGIPVLVIAVVSLYYTVKNGLSVWSCPACGEDLPDHRGSPDYTLRCPGCGVQIDDDLEFYED